MNVHLRYTLASEDRAHLLFLNDAGTEVEHIYNNACRSFRRIQRNGQWWRLAGQDRRTADMIYMQESA